MNLKRLGLVWRLDLGQSARRPLFWILLLIVGFTAYGLSRGSVRIGSGDSTIGGQKSWITSEFASAQMLSIVVFLIYSFFVAVVAGMTVINDDELKVGELLHATSLRPGEYVWGKFLGVLTAFLVVLGLQLLVMMFFNHIYPNDKADEIRGPYAIANYLRPALDLYRAANRSAGRHSLCRRRLDAQPDPGLRISRGPHSARALSSSGTGRRAGWIRELIAS